MYNTLCVYTYFPFDKQPVTPKRRHHAIQVEKIIDNNPCSKFPSP